MSNIKDDIMEKYQDEEDKVTDSLNFVIGYKRMGMTTRVDVITFLYLKKEMNKIIKSLKKDWNIKK